MDESSYRLYHVTKRQNVQSIKEEGLIGQYGKTYSSPTDNAEKDLNHLIDNEASKQLGCDYRPRVGSLFFYTHHPPSNLQKGNTIIRVEFDKLPTVMVAPDRKIEDLFDKLRRQTYGIKVSVPSIDNFVSKYVSFWNGTRKRGAQVWGLSKVSPSKLSVVEYDGNETNTIPLERYD